MTDHMQLIETALEAVEKINSDTSVSQQNTILSLKQIRDEIDLMIDAIEGDIRQQENEEIPF